MAITREEAGEQILEAQATAIDQLGLAVACLGEAYEQLADAEADRLESDLFRPAQKAYARVKRTRDAFAVRSGLPGRPVEPLSPGLRSQGAKAFVEGAIEAAGMADDAIADLQDTMLPIEYGDAELREGLASTRELLATLPGASRELLRTLGR